MWLYFIVAVLLAWNSGYWIGRRQRKPDPDWRFYALDNGWENTAHRLFPDQYDKFGRRAYEDHRSPELWGD